MHPVLCPEFLPENLNKPVVILPRHVDVDVVIPRNEAVMPDGAKRAAAAEEISEMMFCADRNNIPQNAVQRFLQVKELLIRQNNSALRLYMLENFER